MNNTKNLNDSIHKPSHIYFDISPTLKNNLGVFPGDTKFKRVITCDFSQGDPYSLSSMETTLHIGSHADAPIHYHASGETIDQRSLDYYWGTCQVLNIRHEGIITLEVFLDYIKRHEMTIHTKRLLFATGSFANPYEWKNDFAFFSPELIDYVASLGVILVGIDTPSVDASTSKELKAHQALFKNNMANLEGLFLESVPDGVYELVALPLKIFQGEASPVRAVLKKIIE
jgi:arylformamidase